jgi:antitoxin MazE
MPKRTKRMGDSRDRRSTVAPPLDHPRAGWATAARALAKEEDHHLVWPEFGNEDDAELTW